MTEHSKAHILLISFDEAYVGHLSQMLYPSFQLNHSVPQMQHALKALKTIPPDICIVDLDDVRWEGGVYAGFLSEIALATSAPIVVTTQNMTTTRVIEAIRSGARDVVEKDAMREELLGLLENLLRRRPDSTGGHAAKLIAVTSAKHGVGTTVTALALAQDIARRTLGEKRVLFIELNSPPSECADILGVEPQYFITNAVQNIGRLDQTFLENALTQVKDPNFYVLPLAKQMEDIVLLDESEVIFLLSVLKTFFDIIVIDANKEWNATLSAQILLDADYGLICCTQSITAVHATSLFIKELSDIAQDDMELHILITKYDEHIAPQGNHLDSLFEQIDNIWRIPDERRYIETACNLGTPLIGEVAKTRFEQAVDGLISRLFPDIQPLNHTHRFSLLKRNSNSRVRKTKDSTLHRIIKSTQAAGF